MQRTIKAQILRLASSIPALSSRRTTTTINCSNISRDTKPKTKTRKWSIISYTSYTSYTNMASLQFLLCCATTLLIANALELTPQLVSGAANEQAGNKAKLQYTPFSLVEDDVEVEAVELPLDVDQEDNVELLPQPNHSHRPSNIPPWLQFAEDPVQKSRGNSNPSFIKLPLNLQQHKHLHGQGAHGACIIEVTSKVPGVCQPMSKGVGSACISGELMEVYSASHCSNF